MEANSDAVPEAIRLIYLHSEKFQGASSGETIALLRQSLKQIPSDSEERTVNAAVNIVDHLTASLAAKEDTVRAVMERSRKFELILANPEAAKAAVEALASEDNVSNGPRFIAAKCGAGLEVRQEDSSLKSPPPKIKEESQVKREI